MAKSFWVVNDDLTETHINGDPNMSDETLELLMQMFSLALVEVNHTPEPEPPK